MAPDYPNALRMREIKYGAKVSDAQRAATARLLLEGGRTAEVLDLFCLAGDQEGILAVRERALSEGRPHLLIMLERRGQAVAEAEWRRAGQAALAAERFREAYRCFESAGDEQGLAEVREKIPDYEVYTPQGK